MILTALMQLAEDEGLTANLDYQTVAVRWVVTLNAEGRMVGGVADTQRPPASGKGRPVVPLRSVPNRSKRTSGASAEFVVDKAGYVFGVVKAQKPDPERAAEQLVLYKREVALAAERTNDVGLSALRQFLEGPVPTLPAEMVESDNVAFSLYDDDGELITDRPAVRDYWAVRRHEAGFGKGEGPAAVDAAVPAANVTFGVMCLVTGITSEPVRLHPKIKGLPPRSETLGGVPLTSTNREANPAFESYQLGGCGCAPVSQNAADAYEKALNWLLANDRRSSRLSHNSVVVFWAKGGSDAVDCFSEALTRGDPEAIKALYGSPWKGSEVRPDDASPFYCLTLSGAIGRGTVRAWNETTLGRVMDSLADYFKDLEIVRPTTDDGKPRPLLVLLRQLAAQGDLENLAPNLASDLFTAIINGRAFARAVLDQAVRRVRAERTLYADRASLIKAYLCRARRAGDTTIPEVRDVLDETCVAPAYLLGRLFAVLEKVQDDAIGASAGIRDRFYGAASATPVVVYPQLMRKLPHHLGKLPGPSVTFYEKLIQQIADGLQPPAPFPHTLRLEEQGLFAVGYYHQRQKLFTKREKSPTTDETPNA